MGSASEGSAWERDGRIQRSRLPLWKERAWITLLRKESVRQGLRTEYGTQASGRASLHTYKGLPSLGNINSVTPGKLLRDHAGAQGSQGGSCKEQGLNSRKQSTTTIILRQGRAAQ